ncbi:FAD/FMN-containing dehydrogenase [Roseiarcus fermentans]|uniref:FAD/FMN-containing dehydrogenase n=1 Tax=Roseiarcus fermentans TaxID=1473586 RepID=A0A366FC28_9HYPH|nr:FAD-binding oxidoreductase [Roseiarcus fermentans]RBP12222.1 FAD/FMN-containing dehydrogenase [Roseiarcus fermentans]
MTRPYDIAAFRALIGPIKCEDNPVLVKQKSRDFYWYSPVLKRQLEPVTADLVVTPQDERQVATILAAAHELAIPVTARGGGTGNYGQAMPLDGGVLLNLIEMNRILAIAPGRVVCEPGALLADIDKAAAASGQELRMFPSTRATASIGGFIAGGSGGVGSITWGGLRDFGNVLRLRVMTMEASPRTLELTGADLHKAVHAYGTNGIITEVEMPLTAAYDWVDVIVGFDSFDAAAAYGLALGEQDGILKKLVTVIAAPAPARYFLRHRSIIPEGKSVVLAMVAPHALDAFEAFTRPVKGAELLFVSSRAPRETLAGLPPNYELAWNHTTLRALRVDPKITYLQVRYPEDGGLAMIRRIHERFGDEAVGHLEIIRFNGRIGFAGLPLVRFTTEERLQALIDEHEAMGAMVFNPHRYTLEEGGMKQTDATQLAFKRDTDPQGLLNPGKMIAWADPDFDYASGQNFLFPGLEARALAAQS